MHSEYNTVHSEHYTLRQPTHCITVHTKHYSTAHISRRVDVCRVQWDGWSGSVRGNVLHNTKHFCVRRKTCIILHLCPCVIPPFLPVLSQACVLVLSFSCVPVLSQACVPVLSYSCVPVLSPVCPCLILFSPGGSKSAYPSSAPIRRLMAATSIKDPGRRIPV